MTRHTEQYYKNKLNKLEAELNSSIEDFEKNGGDLPCFYKKINRLDLQIGTIKTNAMLDGYEL